MQRLFSMFPNGWPGTGLLLMRMVSGVVLIREGILRPHALVQPFQALAGVLLMLGLGTPAAGVLATICGLWAALGGSDDVQTALLLATIGAALAMLGPGARSLDNHFFGRKRLDVPNV